jgi:hypothetical protein
MLPPVTMKKSNQQQSVELEAELLRLNALVRARRKTLARLAACPNKTCECRLVWSEQTEKTLASQMGKLRQGIGGKDGSRASSKPRPKRSKMAIAR